MNVHTLELSRKITDVEWRILKNYLYTSEYIKKGSVYKENGAICCKHFSTNGIILYLSRFVDKRGYSHCCARLKVNAHNLVNEKSFVELMPLTLKNIDVFESEFSKLLSVMPQGFRVLDDYLLARVDLTMDFNLDEYCRRDLITLGNHAYVPPSWHRELFYDKVAKRKKISARGLKISSQSRAVILYDKLLQLKDAGICDLDYENATGLLRAEMALLKGFIREKQKNFEFDDEQRWSPVVFLRYLERECTEIFLTAFKKIFGTGQYLKLDAALACVNSSGHRESSKSLMRDFLFLCSKRRSVEVAVNEMKENGMSQREIRCLLNLFDDLGVNPLTIPRRWTAESYPSIVTYLENALDL